VINIQSYFTNLSYDWFTIDATGSNALWI